MEIKTKFDLGQRIYIIHKFGNNKYIPCKTCEGKGGITHNNSRFECTECFGNGGKHEWVPESWKITGNKVKIGRVTVQLYRKTFHKNHSDEIMYMVDETGVGSGSNYHEKNCFATEKEALQECEIRNKEDLNTPKNG